MGLTDYTFGDKRIWNAGREYEKERIIKLLEDSRERTNQRIQSEQLTGVDLAERIGVYKTLGNAIALIKGEK